MKALSDILVSGDFSLVVRNIKGEITSYNQKGVRDLIWLIDNEPERLRGAEVADKVVGKAAAGLMVNAGIKSVYATVISVSAIEVLKNANLSVLYASKVDKIVVPDGDARCRLEEIVNESSTPVEIERQLRNYFDKKKLEKNNK